MSHTIGPVLMNGVSTDPNLASVSIFDVGFQRGYGCFEAMRSYRGKVFRLDGHLDRLERSAAHLRIQLTDRLMLRSWCSDVGAGGDGVLRVYVTGGTDASAPGTDNVTVVYLEPLPDLPSSVRLDLLDAPWHADGHVSELTGAKTLSYGPNLAATIEAKSKGYDDAALLGSGGIVLEGPTFSLGWVTDGVLFTPSLDSQILESITREATLEAADRIGVEVSVGRFSSDALLGSDEVFVMSTVREVMPVTAVGIVDFAPGPVTARLREAFGDLVSEDGA
ncbi:MAG: aminodeoxychorismate lyase [Acidimicrobiia bacterium]|nr:MAG: aminodeoxychorismate lyase [Acidimicrobiia bacterium]